MSVPSIPPSINPLREITALREAVASLNGALIEQRDLLRQRGMNLPPAVLNAINTLEDDVKRLEEYLYEEQTELGQLRALAQMSSALTTSLESDVVLTEAMDIIIALTKAERGCIVLIDQETGAMQYVVSREDSLVQMKGGKSQISATVLQEVLTTRAPLLADNAFGDERLLRGESVANFAIRSVLCVPLMYREELIGVVYVDNRLQQGMFTQRELTMLTAFANTAAVAINNAMSYANIQNLLGEITQVKDLMDSIFASIASGVIATDADDRITTFNRAAENILAMSAGDAIGHTMNAVLPRLMAGLSDQLEQVRQTKIMQTTESELLVGERGQVALTMTLNPLKDGQDNLRGFALVLDDVTRQRERETQLNTIRTYLPPEMVDNIQTISGLALGGESREVTCIFAEVRSLSTLHDTAPKAMLAMLNDYFGLATEAINAHQGILDKYMGTEVMALFNTQLNPMEDHAARAIEAALQMREQFVALYARQGIQPAPHYYRIGMHTGVCTLGNVGSISRRDFTAIGDTINLSHRVLENTPYGKIIVSEDTWQHARQQSRARFVALGDLKAKGREETKPIYEVFRD